MRIFLAVLRPQPDAGKQLPHALGAPCPRHLGVVVQRLSDDLAGRQARIERGVGILENELDDLAVLAHLARRAGA